MATRPPMLTAIFHDRASATRAFNWMQTRGYRSNEINLLMTDRTRATFGNQGSEGQIKAGSKATEGVAAGGAVGTAVGATLAAIAAIGTSVVVPGMGLVMAGPLIAALAGGGAGAIAGGAIGGLVGLGIPASNSHAYEEALRNGGVVFGVVPRSTEDATVIRSYFEEQKADNVVYA